MRRFNLLSAVLCLAAFCCFADSAWAHNDWNEWRPPTNQVPDAGASGLLLGAAFGGLALGRKWLFKK